MPNANGYWLRLRNLWRRWRLRRTLARISRLREAFKRRAGDEDNHPTR